ncbi:MAG: nitrilase [Roseibium sp.]|nr:nitrilase [Roseibium sp.]
MPDYKIALWSLHLGFSPADTAAFAAHVEAGLARAADAGARLLMLPEYAIEACLAFKPDGLPETSEIPFLADCGAELVGRLRDLPARHGVSLLMGTMPVRVGDGGYTNTAILLTPDGREIRQDKLCLTPGEQDPGSWSLQPGRVLHTFELDGLKMAILICLDVELPALSCLLAGEDLDLLLVPSMTERLAGHHRVYDCAKARAVELMTCVTVCGTVGAARGTTQNLTNVSGAAVYTPCEAELGHTGLAAFAAPTDGADGEEPFLVADVPVESVRRLRRGGAEVWPGAWRAGHVALERR